MYGSDRMDILVTTPKSEIDNSIDEAEALEESGGYYFRTYRFRPKVEVGACKGVRGNSYLLFFMRKND